MFAHSSGRPGRGRGTIDAVTASRYRCTACGNLTRFDVTMSQRSRAYHHYTVGGELRIEDLEMLTEVIEEVSCRWCGTGSAVRELSVEDAAAIDDDGAGGDGEVAGYDAGGDGDAAPNGGSAG
jgi:hypothetical protein